MFGAWVVCVTVITFLGRQKQGCFRVMQNYAQASWARSHFIADSTIYMAGAVAIH